MFDPGHTGRAVAIAFTAALALALATPAPAERQKEFVRYSIAGDTRLVSPLISPPPKLARLPMHWFHWHQSARALQGRADDFGSVAVLGLESMRDLEALRDSYGFDQVQAFPALHAAEVSVNARQLHALLTNAPTDSRIRYVAPVGPSRRLLDVPNDPLVRTVDPNTNLPYEWQFSTSGVDRALNLPQGSSTIVVGTIDSGAAQIPDLAGKIDGRWFYTAGAASAAPPEGEFDPTGHGTAVASLIAANVDDGFGMAGFGGAAHVIAFRDDTLTDVSIAIALSKLVSLRCRIINMSIGGSSPDSPILVDALHQAARDGVLLVASAGNDAGFVSFPAADLQPGNGERSFGLAIGASNLNGGLASFSNSGKHLSLVAPGEYSGKCSGVLVAIPPVTSFDQSCYPTWTGQSGARYAYIAGTSFSAPEVSGVAALVWAARPELKNYEVADIIKQSARRNAKTGWTSTMGCGVLDAAAAVELASRRLRTDTLTRDCSTAQGAPPSWPTDVTAPTALALPATGGWGTLVSLPFKVTEDRGEVAVAIVVQRDGKTRARLTQDFSGIENKAVYALGWQAPKARTKGRFRFCVTLSDRAGNKSVPGCASISLG